MCGFCGVWGTKVHWGTRAYNPGVFGPLQESAARLGDRSQEAVVMNAALRGSGVRVRDWSGTQWVVEHASGATLIVDSVAEVWAASERLSRRRIDPLDCAVTHGLTAPDAAPGALVA